MNLRLPVSPSERAFIHQPPSAISSTQSTAAGKIRGRTGHSFSLIGHLVAGMVWASATWKVSRRHAEYRPIIRASRTRLVTGQEEVPGTAHGK